MIWPDGEECVTAVMKLQHPLKESKSGKKEKKKLKGKFDVSLQSCPFIHVSLSLKAGRTMLMSLQLNVITDN